MSVPAYAGSGAWAGFSISHNQASDFFKKGENVDGLTGFAKAHLRPKLQLSGFEAMTANRSESIDWFFLFFGFLIPDAGEVQFFFAAKPRIEKLSLASRHDGTLVWRNTGHP